MRTLKQLLMLSTILILAFAGTSCNPKPNNEIVKTHAEFSHWEMGKRVEAISYEIEPTAGQAYHYAFKAGYTLWFSLGILLVGIGGLLIYMERIGKPVFGKGSVKSAQSNSIAAGIAFALAIACFGGQIGWIQFNNNKAIPKAQYEYYMEKDGHIRAVWDSLYINNKLLGAPSK